MRITALFLTAAFLLAAGTASAACPGHPTTASNDQTTTSSDNSTPVPRKTGQGSRG